jgi:hypothetical protein
VVPSSKELTDPHLGNIDKTKQEGLNVEAIGMTGKVSVDDVFVTISHEGATKLNKINSRLLVGYTGEKKIAISQITAIQFKEVGESGKNFGEFMNKGGIRRSINKSLYAGNAGATGFIEFVIAGSMETKGRLLGGANDIAKNENAVMFGMDSEEEFKQIRNHIENIIRERFTTQPLRQEPSVAAPDVATQITSLKQLLDSGVLTDEEFQKAKSKILGI